MASLAVRSLSAYSEYKDRFFEGSQEAYTEQISSSSTLYVGNLSFFTTEQQLYALFARIGPINRIIMGLDRNKLTPCGFCFVVYESRKDAMDAIECITGTKLDDRYIRVDLDPGFLQGRQYGRGKSGGQVRDELRGDYDEGRGGYGQQQRGMTYERGHDSQQPRQYQQRKQGGGNKRRNYDDQSQGGKRSRED